MLTAAIVIASMVLSVLLLAVIGGVGKLAVAVRVLAVALHRSAQAHETGLHLSRLQIEMTRQLVEASKHRPAPVIVSVAEGATGVKH